MALKLKTAASTKPISLALAKQQCKVEHSEEDALITLYIDAVTDLLRGPDGQARRALINEQWELTYDAFPCEGIEIPLGPLVSVDKVEYIDAITDTYVEWPALGNYVVDLASWKGWVAPVSAWPTAKNAMNAVRITFTAGYGTTETTVPARLRQAMLMAIGHWYQNRETVSVGNITSNLPLGFDDLVRSVRGMKV